jgi:hypothetical protein
MGDTATTTAYTNDVLFSSINDGLADMNLEYSTQYEVIGSSSSAYFSPTPSATDQRLIVLFSAIALTRGEIQKSARAAISHSNPAGRTDLTRIPEILMKHIEGLEDKIAGIMRDSARVSVETEADTVAWGEELKGRPTEVAEGLGIVNIEKTV